MAKKTTKSKSKSTGKGAAAKKATTAGINKKSAKKSARKNAPAAKSKKKPKLGLNSRIRKVVQIDALDQILLNMAAKPYDKILKQIESGKKRLNEERRIALQLGTRILNKARRVRDSLMNINRES